MMLISNELNALASLKTHFPYKNPTQVLAFMVT
jgi:hypothetical protein